MLYRCHAMPALGDKYDGYERWLRHSLAEAFFSGETYCVEVATLIGNVVALAVLRLGDEVHPYISNMTYSPACWMSCCDEDGYMKTVADSFSVVYFVRTVTFPIPYGLDVVSHPLSAYRKSILSEIAGPSFFFLVMMHIVCFALTMYRVSLLSVALA